jgi:hypothetical protein
MTTKTKTLNKEDILKIITSLSYSQGLYGRLLRDIKENPDILDYLEKQNLKSDLDLVLFIEC